MKFALTALVVVLSTATLSAQENWKWKKTFDSTSKVNELRRTFNTDDVEHGYAAVEQQSVITFEQTKDGRLVCNHLHRYVIMGMEDNEFVIIPVFRNDIISLNDRTLKVGDKLKDDVTYYRMEWQCFSNYDRAIFSSDAEQCLHGFASGEGDLSMFEINQFYSDIKYFSRIGLRGVMPVQKRTIAVLVPDWLDMEFHQINMEGFGVDQSESEVSYNGDDCTKYVFVAEDVKPYPREDNAPGGTHYEPQLALVFKSYTDKSGEEQTLFATNQDVYDWYHGLALETEENDISIEFNGDNAEDLAAMLSNALDASMNLGDAKEALEATVKELEATCTTDAEKVEAVYYWIQDHIRYIAFEDGIMGFKPEPAALVLQKRFGDCKGMANLAKVMLTQMGVDARLTWIGTNHLGPAFNYDFPSLANDNHMICTVYIDGKEYFVDPTEKWIGLGDCADRIQGRKAMVEDGDTFKLVQVPQLGADRNVFDVQRSVSFDQNTMRAKVDCRMAGEEKVDMFRSYADPGSGQVPIEDLARYVEGRSKDLRIRVGDQELHTIDNRADDLNFSYDIEYTNFVAEASDELFFPLDWDEEFKYFDLDEDRETAYDLRFALNRKYTTRFEIPAGYQIGFVPEPLHIDGLFFSIDIEAQVEGNTLVYTKQIRFENGMIPAANIPTWNAAVEQLQNTYSQYASLKRS